jgi:hypothetical protein
MSTATSPRTDLRANGLEHELELIRSNFEVTLYSEAQIGGCLARIKDQGLYLAKYPSFSDFVHEELEINHVRAKKLVDIHTAWEDLAKQLPNGFQMPHRSTHLWALKMAPPNHRGTLWRLVVENKHLFQGKISHQAIETIFHEHFALKDNGLPRNKIPARITSEQARIKVGEICGSELLRKIDRGQCRVTEQEFIMWAKQEPEMIAYIGRAMDKMGWQVVRSIHAFHQQITGESTIKDIVSSAIAHDRPVTIHTHGYTLTATPDGQ